VLLVLLKRLCMRKRRLSRSCERGPFPERLIMLLFHFLIAKLSKGFKVGRQAATIPREISAADHNTTMEKLSGES
jgi:hypothetical protein